MEESGSEEWEESGSESETESGSDSEPYEPQKRKRKRKAEEKAIRGKAEDVHKQQQRALNATKNVALRKQYEDAEEEQEEEGEAHREYLKQRKHRRKKEKRTVTQDNAATRDAERSASQKNKQLTLSAFSMEFMRHLADPKTKHHKMKKQEEYDAIVDVVTIAQKPQHLRKQILLRTFSCFCAERAVCVKSLSFAQKHAFCLHFNVFAQHLDYFAQLMQHLNCCRAGWQVVRRYELENKYLLYAQRLQQWIRQDPDNNSEANFSDPVRTQCVSCLHKTVCFCVKLDVFAQKHVLKQKHTFLRKISLVCAEVTFCAKSHVFVQI